ncbi:MAG: GAF domain-containing protein [Candidatus Eisenbacteria bacterium]|nr:GAF domain-containing protein [Candidatus Eisenbacteria bacterium]
MPRRKSQTVHRRLAQVEALQRMSEQIVRAADVDGVCQLAIDGVRSTIAPDRSAVLLLRDGTMRFVAWQGLSDGYRAAVEGHSPWSLEDPDPQPVVIPDALDEPSLAGLIDVVRNEGVRSLSFIPLVHEGRLLGKFMLYWDEVYAPSPDETRLAQAIASHVSVVVARHKHEADLQAARDRAVAATRAKGEFLATMSHEIRTPMNAILGFASLLVEARLPGEHGEWVRTIYTSGQAMLRILNDILDFSKMEAGRFEMEIAPFDLERTLRDGISLLTPLAAAKEIDLHLDVLGLNRAIAQGDPARVRQVLHNLIGNAVKFTHRGTVTVRARIAEGTEGAEGGDRVRIEVVDTGIGIPADKIGSLFERFTQIGTSDARHYGGTGLGLAISRRLVELMGGEIGVTSESGQGSCFWFELPASRQAADVRHAA